MPYTPPASQSPDASKPETTEVTRSHSFSKSQHQNGGVHIAHTRPNRHNSSSSYLHKHRRSPSVHKTEAKAPSVADTEAELLRRPDDEDQTPGNPRPRTPTRPIVTTGTVISPPESSQNSSDDEINTKRGRVRELANLAELQAAIRIIEQHRMSSPDRTGEETRNARTTLGLPNPSIKVSRKIIFQEPEQLPGLPVSSGGRKISHSRSSTDPNAFLDFPLRDKTNALVRRTSVGDVQDDELRASQRNSDSDNEEEGFGMRPPMVRKKSGELVRPALRPASAKRRPSSMPGTPTYSKAVHFDPRLEQVRHFLQVDKPLAVSAGSSPAESIVDDDAIIAPRSGDIRPQSPSFEWEIRLTNFPANTPGRRSRPPVIVERVYLSSDNKKLMGAVAARNIAFHKVVVSRFTFDYWKTTSEVVADYDNDVRRKQPSEGYDKFLFSIRLEDQANLEKKTLFFCVRYNVNGQEFWDNNNSFNYQVDFSKKAKPQNVKNGMQARPINELPPCPTFLLRPRSAGASPPDDFASSFDFSSFPQPSAVIGDSPIRLRNGKVTSHVAANIPVRRANPAGQAFGNRYDFGASLSAAIQAANSGILTREDANSAPQNSVSLVPPSTTTVPHVNEEADGCQDAENSSVTFEQRKPTALTAEKPSLQSSSYHELLDKYCFVGYRVDQEVEE